MPYATINGITLPVATGNGERSDDSLATQPRTASGGFTNEIRARRSKYAFTTGLLTLDEASTWELLLRGLGHRWSFDADLYSSKSLLFTTDVNATIVTAHPKFGAGNLQIVTTPVSYWDLDTPDGWTVGVWYYNGGTWQHRLHTSNGTQWQDGVQGSYAWSLAPSVGIFSLDTGEWDDLVFLPFAITDAMGDAWPLADTFSALPTLTLDGDCVYNRAVAVRGMWDSVAIDHIDGSKEGAWQTLCTLSIVLREE